MRGRGQGPGKTSLSAERAVSPVIGTVLLVAVVVVLATTLGALAFGLEDGTEKDRSVNVRFTFTFEDYDDSREDEFAITHEGGETVFVGEGSEDDSVLAGDLYIVADQPFEDDTLGGAGGTGFECPELQSPGHYECSFNFDNDFQVPGDEMTAGETFQLFATEPDTPFEEATVRIVYKPERSSQTYVVAEWVGPEAGG